MFSMPSGYIWKLSRVWLTFTVVAKWTLYRSVLGPGIRIPSEITQESRTVCDRQQMTRMTLL